MKKIIASSVLVYVDLSAKALNVEIGLIETKDDMLSLPKIEVSEDTSILIIRQLEDFLRRKFDIKPMPKPYNRGRPLHISEYKNNKNENILEITYLSQSVDSKNLEGVVFVHQNDIKNHPKISEEDKKTLIDTIEFLGWA